MSGYRRRRLRGSVSRGFTLIEILVVVVIIAIATSIVLLSINVIDDDRELEREARRLAALVEAVADEAELQGRDFGIEFIRDGYRFVEYDPYFDTWAEVVGDNLLRPRSLPDGFEFSLVIEDKRIELGNSMADTGDADDEDEPANTLLNKYAPHSMILSSGDLSPFDASIVRIDDGAERAVRVLPSGEIEIGGGDEDLG